jgi:hypothetical protein
MTLTCKVINDFANRTLFVRLPDTAGGTQRVAWRRAQQALVQAENEGYQSQRGAPQLWARGVGAGDRIAYGTPGDAWDTLKFFFPAPDPAAAYSKLIGKPGLYALVTVDNAKGFFMGCSFLHRP